MAMKRFGNPVMLISIVVPLYNKAPWVIRALTSVAGQTHPDFECLVVNDGSTDGGDALVAEFARNDPRFRLITQTNAGVSAARNTGWQAAPSDWIAFLDADDEWRPEFLAATTAVAQDAPDTIGIIATNYDLNDHPLGNNQPPPKAISLDSGVIDNFFKTWFTLERNPVISSACVVRRQALEAVNGFVPGLVYMEDSYCWVRIGLRYQVFFIDRVLATYTTDDAHSAVAALYGKPILSNYLTIAKLYRLDKALFLRHPFAVKYLQYEITKAAMRFWRGGYRSLAIQLMLHFPRPLSCYGMGKFSEFLLQPMRRFIQQAKHHDAHQSPERQ